LSYGVDGLRFVLTGIGQFNIILDFGVVLVISLIITVIGSYMFSKIQV
jgi:ABC-2 type transport system permease protein